LVSDVPNVSNANKQRIVKWSLWPISASLVCVAISTLANPGCGATGGRHGEILGAAVVTGLATAFTLWGPLRAWWALALSLVATAIVGGGLIIFGVLVWVHDCAN
jgi:hypothetical protein